MFVNTKKRMIPDPAQTSPFDPPQPAITFQKLNEDVMVASNEGPVDKDAPEPGEANCYSPLELLSKSKQETLLRVFLDSHVIA